MSRRLSLEPNVTGGFGVPLGEVSPNRTNQRLNGGEKMRRKSTLLAYTNMFSKADGETEEQDENNTQGEGTYPRQARRMSGGGARQRGGILGGSLQDNMTGELMPARSAKKPSHRYSQVADVIPFGAYEGGARVSLITMQDRRDFHSFDGKTTGVEKLVRFLSERGYSGRIGRDELMSPTLSTFREVLRSIISLVDPYTSTEIEVKVKSKQPWENIACKFFKDLRYPWNLSAKQIPSVGSANAWPKFLGALVWLTELIDNCEINVEPALARNKERTAQNDAIRFAYQRYMQGDDSAMDQLLLKLRASADAQGTHIQKMIDDANQRVRELKHQFNKLTGVPGEITEDATNASTSGNQYSIESLRLHLDSLRSDAGKLKGAIDMWKKKIDKAKADTVAEEERLVESQKELVEMRAKRDVEQRKLDSQVLKNSDLARIGTEKKRLEQVFSELNQEKEQVLERVWSSNEKVKIMNESLRAKIADANTRIARLAQKSRERVTTELDAKSLITPGAGEGQLEHARTMLSTMFERLLNMADDARNKSRELQDLSDRNNSECRSIEMEVESHRRKMQYMEDKLRDDARQRDAELETVEEETRQAQTRLDSFYSGAWEELQDEAMHLKGELKRQRDDFRRDDKEYSDLVTQECLVPLADLKQYAESVASLAGQKIDEMKKKSDKVVSTHKAFLSANRQSIA